MQLKTHLIAAAALCAALGANAQTVRIANQGDSLSMDPHSLNESLQLSVTGNVYEGLFQLTDTGNVEPVPAEVEPGVAADFGIHAGLPSGTRALRRWSIANRTVTRTRNASGSATASGSTRLHRNQASCTTSSASLTLPSVR